TNHALPYETQDLWIYTGQRLGQTLAYLIPIFEIGGEPVDVNTALGGNLAGTYWEWVKNQVYEKEIVHPGRTHYPPCGVEASLVDLHPFVITAPQGQLTIPNTLDELSAIAYSISFTGDQEPSLSITVKGAGPDIFYKIYKQGEACDTVV